MPEHPHVRIAWHTLRVAAALALALLVVFGTLVLTLSYLSSHPALGERAPQQTFSDEQKLQVLSSLQASSTPTSAQKKQTLKTIQSTTTVSEAQKLDILKQLQHK